MYTRNKCNYNEEQCNEEIHPDDRERGDTIYSGHTECMGKLYEHFFKILTQKDGNVNLEQSTSILQANILVYINKKYIYKKGRT